MEIRIHTSNTELEDYNAGYMDEYLLRGTVQGYTYEKDYRLQWTDGMFIHTLLVHDDEWVNIKPDIIIVTLGRDTDLSKQYTVTPLH